MHCVTELHSLEHKNEFPVLQRHSVTRSASSSVPLGCFTLEDSHNSCAAEIHCICVGLFSQHGRRFLGNISNTLLNLCQEDLMNLLKTEWDKSRY